MSFFYEKATVGRTAACFTQTDFSGKSIFNGESANIEPRRESMNLLKPLFQFTVPIIMACAFSVSAAGAGSHGARRAYRPAPGRTVYGQRHQASPYRYYPQRGYGAKPRYPYPMYTYRRYPYYQYMSYYRYPAYGYNTYYYSYPHYYGYPSYAYGNYWCPYGW